MQTVKTNTRKEQTINILNTHQLNAECLKYNMKKNNFIGEQETK